MSESIIPVDTDFDLTQPPGRLDRWARKIVTRLFSKITWGRIKVVENTEVTLFGKSKMDDQPEVTLEYYIPDFTQQLSLAAALVLLKLTWPGSVSAAILRNLSGYWFEIYPFSSEWIMDLLG